MTPGIASQRAGVPSSFDPAALIGKMEEKQQKLVEPIQTRRDETQVKYDTWVEFTASLDAVRGATDAVAQNSLWGKKQVTSAAPEVLQAEALNNKAVPGSNLVWVDKLALNHQIGSRPFSAADQSIAHGEFKIKLDSSDEFTTITIDEKNDTYQGFVNSINRANVPIKAAIIRTGEQEENAYQIVLTAEESGAKNRIVFEASFAEEDSESPEFENFFLQPSEWKYAFRPDDSKPSDSLGSKVSSAIPTFSGEYIGDEELEFRFTSVKDGVIGGDESVQLRWQDSSGRRGLLNLDKFSYSPGAEVEVIDGIKLAFTRGNIAINDSFTVAVKPDETGAWFVFEENEPAKIYEPSAWSNQSTKGSIEISGDYIQDFDDEYTLEVLSGGRVGESENVTIRYTSEEGVEGILDFGKAYDPGDKLSLDNGLEISITGGVLEKGAISSFEVEAPISGLFWWLFEEDSDGKPATITEPTPWSGGEGDYNVQAEDYLGAESSKSNADKSVTGSYTGVEDKTYTFTVVGVGAVGVTQDLFLDWEDDLGNSGQVSVGQGYEADTGIDFDSGLQILLKGGRLYNGDSFTLKALSATIQKPQDAQIRLGGTAEGGGLEITNSSNTFTEAIPNVKLELLNVSDTPIQVNVKDDTETIKEKVKALIDSANETISFIRESTKYDSNSDTAGPLQADSTISGIHQRLKTVLIDPIVGLDQTKNTLTVAGIELTREGLLEFDEKKFDEFLGTNADDMANLFRVHGQSDNEGIIFAGANENTLISGKGGYAIDITKSATRGRFESEALPQSVLIDETNRNVLVSINGRESDIIELDTGTKTAQQIATELKDKIKEDEKLANAKFSLEVVDQKILLESRTYGQNSRAEIKAAPINSGDPPAFMQGEVITGENVEGTIDGEPMDTIGQVLSGKKGTKHEGLRIVATLDSDQLAEGVDGKLIVTRGVAAKLQDFLEKELKPNTGNVDTKAKTFQDQIRRFDERLERFRESTERKAENLRQQYARVEAKISELQTQQKYLARSA